MAKSYHTVKFTLSGAFTIEVLSRDAQLAQILTQRMHDSAVRAVGKVLSRYVSERLPIAALEMMPPDGGKHPVSAWVVMVSIECADGEETEERS